MTDQEILQQFERMNSRMDQMSDRMELMLKSITALNDKIDSVEQRMTEKIDSVEQRMADRQDRFEEHMMEEFRKVLDTMDAKFVQQDQKIAESIHEVKVYMELAVGNRVTSLYEGYEIEHSHRVGLERDTKWMERRLDDIQTRLAILESKETA